MEREITAGSTREVHHVCSCCTTDRMSWVWGGALILAGSVWLLSNLDVLPGEFHQVFWPLVLVALGVASLARHRSS